MKKEIADALIKAHQHIKEHARCPENIWTPEDGWLLVDGDPTENGIRFYNEKLRGKDAKEVRNTPSENNK